MDNRRASNHAEKRISKRKQEEIAEQLLLEQNEGTFDFYFTTEDSKFDEDKGGAEVACNADLIEEEWTGNEENRMHSTAHCNTDTDIVDTHTVMMRDEESENMIISSSTLIDVGGDGGSYDEQDNENGKQLFEVTATSSSSSSSSSSSAIGEAAERSLNAMNEAAECSMNAMGEAAECSLNAMNEAAECSLNAMGEAAECSLNAMDDEAAECSLSAMDEAAEASAPMLLFDEEVRVISFNLLLHSLLFLLFSVLYYYSIY